ncbi:hypothetical protein FRC20_007094, partial [Serendipita sp. 405]
MSSKRSKRSNRLEYHEQDADDESGVLVASDASARRPPSSYLEASKLHFDDTSQYFDVTTMLSQLPRYSGHFNFTSSHSALATLDLAIEEDTDLPKPLAVTRHALKAVILSLQKVIKMGDSDWLRPAKLLKTHHDTVKDQLNKLDEDKDIDMSALPFDLTVKELLRCYANKLGNIHDLARKRSLYPQRTTVVTEGRLRDLDETFHQYMRGLHHFVASTVNQMREDLSQVDHTFLQNALTTYSSRTEDINAYGVQHGQCCPGTRIETLNAIRQWAKDDNLTNWMFCLLDHAGSGKSTVSKHMDLEWGSGAELFARFFFSRDTAETMSIKRFCSIVANAFAAQDETFNTVMEQFKKRHDYELLSFEQQFDGLIAGPLKALNRRAILIIDALDECDNEHNHRDKLLKTISNQSLSIPHLRIFVTGRPERDIKQWATTTAGVNCTNFFQLEGNYDDVERYIKERLGDLPSNSQAGVSRVVENAEGVFIWARIA